MLSELPVQHMLSLCSLHFLSSSLLLSGSACFNGQMVNTASGKTLTPPIHSGTKTYHSLLRILPCLLWPFPPLPSIPHIPHPLCQSPCDYSILPARCFCTCAGHKTLLSNLQLLLARLTCLTKRCFAFWQEPKDWAASNLHNLVWTVLNRGVTDHRSQHPMLFFGSKDSDKLARDILVLVVSPH